MVKKRGGVKCKNRQIPTGPRWYFQELQVCAYIDYSDVIRTRMVFVGIFSPPAVGSTGKGCKAQTGQCCRNVEYGAPSSDLATASPLICQPHLQLLGHAVQRSPYSRLQLRQLLAPLRRITCDWQICSCRVGGLRHFLAGPTCGHSRKHGFSSSIHTQKTPKCCLFLLYPNVWPPRSKQARL
jgi:hypothetical protein